MDSSQKRCHLQAKQGEGQREREGERGYSGEGISERIRAQRHEQDARI